MPLFLPETSSGSVVRSEPLVHCHGTFRGALLFSDRACHRTCRRDVYPTCFLLVSLEPIFRAHHLRVRKPFIKMEMKRNNEMLLSCKLFVRASSTPQARDMLEIVYNHNHGLRGCSMHNFRQTICTISSHQDRSKHFTLYFPGRPIKSNAV